LQSPEPNPQSRSAVSYRATWLATLATTSYIALIAAIGAGTGLSFVLFPELGALSHDILRRPHGIWARAPWMLVITPLLTGLAGTLITRHFAYGAVSVLATIGAALIIIRLLRSPITPAISAGLLPLTLGEPSWWYPPSLLAGLSLLAILSQVRRRIVPLPPATSGRAGAGDVSERAPSDYTWIPFFLLFLIAALTLIVFTGWRLLLFPPLVVIGFEMFARASTCPWAGRPFVVPLVCTSSAASGVILVGVFGVGPLAAALSIGCSIVILHAFKLHLPPALAVGLLPFVISHPSNEFPVAVAAGTALLAASFTAWRRIFHRSRTTQ